MSGKLSDCPIFTLQSQEEQQQCKFATTPTLASEKIDGVIGTSLPGGVEIHFGPGPANVQSPPSESTPVPVPSVGYSAGETASGTNYVPGGVFKEEPTTAPDVIALAQPSPTTTAAPSDPPIPEGYELVRTDYVTEGKTVRKIIVVETVEYVMVATETVTVTSTFGAQKARRHLQHLHRHAHGSH